MQYQEYESPYDLFNRVGEYVRTPIPVKLGNLMKERSKVDALRYELAETIKKTSYVLNTRRMSAKQPKDKNITDLDRDVEIRGATAQIQADYDFLLELKEIIADRLKTTDLWFEGYNAG